MEEEPISDNWIKNDDTDYRSITQLKAPIPKAKGVDQQNNQGRQSKVIVDIGSPTNALAKHNNRKHYGTSGNGRGSTGNQTETPKHKYNSYGLGNPNPFFSFKRTEQK